VFVSKRGQRTGYSGIENPLLHKENTRMFHGDVKASIDRLVQAVLKSPTSLVVHWTPHNSLSGGKHLGS
jgi:NAD(P) transhydrogenase beta subunit